MRLVIIFGIALLVLQGSSEAFASPNRWTALARKVGASEENRGSAIRELRSMPDLNARLEQGLTTDDRPLALEVICDLELKSFVPRLLALVGSDQDGFTTLSVNSMMDESNRASVLHAYSVFLTNLQLRSPGAIVAMLEPLGRLGTRLPRAQLVALKDHPSPEVRDALLYYLRIMTLHHRNRNNADLLETLAHDQVRQIREHAGIIAEELRAPGPTATKLATKLVAK